MYLPAKNSCSYTLDRSLTNTRGLKFNCKAAATWESKLELWLHKESGTPASWIEESKSWHVPSKGCENMLPSEFFPKLLLSLFTLLIFYKCSVRIEPFWTFWRIHIHFIFRMLEIRGWDEKVITWSGFSQYQFSFVKQHLKPKWFLFLRLAVRDGRKAILMSLQK